MEAGYDYLLLRGRLKRRFFNVSGIFVFVFGAMLLATSGAYYGYAAKAHADLDSLNVTLPEAAVKIGGGLGSQGSIAEILIDHGQEGLYSLSIPGLPEGQSSNQAGAPMVQGPGGVTTGSTDGADASKVTVGAASAEAGEDPVSASGPSSTPRLVMPASVISNQQLFPGESLQASFWSNPLSYESASYRERILLQGFNPVDLNQGLAVDSGSPATRLIIPSIDVDSRVDELAILDLGGSRAYETPANTVGHIPKTANAGEAGSGWFFGHTESPIQGEGSVFLNLSKIPGKLQNGEDVFVVTSNGERQYLYRVTSTQVVPQEEMALYETGKATIHLVSCVPRLVYDYRLIVTGELIGEK
jgi:LPXTG-site transpeptidase (sortase) family protein